MNRIYEDIVTERAKQDDRWGGPSHDDHHSVDDFVQFIEDYAGWARMQASQRDLNEARKRLIQVAALSVAAIELIDRIQEANTIIPR